MKALAENRDDRFATAGEFGTEISRFLAERGRAKEDGQS
jgi:hypothetical protein